MKTTKWSFAIITLALIGGVVLYVAFIRAYYKSVTPPQRCGIEIFSKQVRLERLKKCNRNGSVFYLAKGQFPPDYVLASGPPVYVFDSKGMLVEWIKDSGDQPSDMERWNVSSFSSCRDVTLEYVLNDIKNK